MPSLDLIFFLSIGRFFYFSYCRLFQICLFLRCQKFNFVMRVLVMNRCIRPRSLRLRKVRGCNSHCYHCYFFSFRPSINL